MKIALAQMGMTRSIEDNLKTSLAMIADAADSHADGDSRLKAVCRRLRFAVRRMRTSGLVSQQPTAQITDIAFDFTDCGGESGVILASRVLKPPVFTRTGG